MLDWWLADITWPLIMANCFSIIPCSQRLRRVHPPLIASLNANLHSPERQLIELRMEHADLDATIDYLVDHKPLDELMLQRLKKRRLALRDRILRLELSLDPKEPA